MINSRNLQDLHPTVRAKAQEFIKRCQTAGISVLVTSTYRDSESQTALYAQGRTTPGKIVTKAKAGQSYHNWRVAFDFVPVVNGQAAWGATELFNQCGSIAIACGLEWAGNWKNFKELPHCQYTGGLTWQDFQNGKQLS